MANSYEQSKGNILCLLAAIKSALFHPCSLVNNDWWAVGEGPAGLSKLLHQLIAQHCDCNANEQDDVNYPVVVVATTDSLDQVSSKDMSI